MPPKRQATVSKRNAGKPAADAEKAPPRRSAPSKAPEKGNEKVTTAGRKRKAETIAEEKPADSATRGRKKKKGKSFFLFYFFGRRVYFFYILFLLDISYICYYHCSFLLLID